MVRQGKEESPRSTGRVDYSFSGLRVHKRDERHDRRAWSEELAFLTSTFGSPETLIGITDEINCRGLKV